MFQLFEGYKKEEKAAIFDEIMDKYLTNGFHSMTKGEWDTYLFHVLFQYLSVHDKGNTSDYRLSKMLGITQSRIRNLKIREGLVYRATDYENNWKTFFSGYIENALYDKYSGVIKMNIPDVNVLSEVRNFMEENGWYDEYQLNPKLFQCNLGIFLQLCEKIEPAELSDQASSFLKNLEKQADCDKTALDFFKKGEIGKGVKKLGKKISKETLDCLMNIIPAGGIVRKTINIAYRAIAEN